MSSHSTDLSILDKTSVKFAPWVPRVTEPSTHQYTYTAKRTAANVAVHKCDELKPKAAVSEVPEVLLFFPAYNPGSKLNVVSEAGPVKDAPTIDASQLDASRNSDHHARTLLPSRPLMRIGFQNLGASQPVRSNLEPESCVLTVFHIYEA